MNLFNEAGQRTKEVVKLRTNPDGSLHVEVGDTVLYKYMKSEKSFEEMQREGLDIAAMLSQPLKETVVPAIIYALNGQQEATLALLTGDAEQPVSYLYSQKRGTGVDQWEVRG